jgi:hemerythrin-like domain-containing protein
MTTIFDSLRSDHDRQRHLLSAVEETHGDSARRRELFEQVTGEIETHARAEEKILYARMLAAPAGREIAAHSIAEHEEIRELLDDLTATDMSSSAWITKLRTLKDTIEHHLDEEEDEMFAKAREVLGDQECLEFQTAFERERDAVARAL